MPWKRVAFSADDILLDRQRRLMHEFTAMYIGAGVPRDAAMFEDDDNVCYFSPRAVEIAGGLIMQFGGEDCPPPLASKIGLLAGSDSYEGIVFSPEPEEDDNN